MNQFVTVPTHVKVLNKKKAGDKFVAELYNSNNGELWKIEMSSEFFRVKLYIPGHGGKLIAYPPMNRDISISQLRQAVAAAEGPLGGFKARTDKMIEALA